MYNIKIRDLSPRRISTYHKYVNRNGHIWIISMKGVENHENTIVHHTWIF